MVKSTLRFLAGALLIIGGISLRLWWHAIITDSGGPDGGLIVMVPYFISMFAVAAGLVLAVQGIIRLFRKPA
ncbi:hypothetical protein LJK88_43085 [Paenibacillus sp. P26]|nr:hypothetical protein LJK88_43085 [Paenibacillus sp. P26]UUZ92468.1 hypothetical protein LJK87_45180 [Paenibacillus sp. P25]